MTTTPTLWLAPILVNSTDAGPDDNDQTNSQVIALSNGRFFVAFNDNGNAVGLGAPDIYGRFIDAEGNFVGGPLAGNDFLLNGFIDFCPGSAGYRPRPEWRLHSRLSDDV